MRRDAGKPVPRPRRDRREREARVTLSDVRRLRFHNQISCSIKPYVGEAELELGAWVADKPGLSEAERSILVDASRVGLMMKALFAVFVRSEEPDPELAKTVSTLAGQRRASLAAVGLERRARPITLEGVVTELVEAKAAQDGAGRENGAASDAGVEDAHEVAGEGA